MEHPARARKMQAEMHGQRVVMVAGVYAGPGPEGGAAVLAPLAGLGTGADGRRRDRRLRTRCRASCDAAFPAGGRYLFKSHFMTEGITNAAVDAMVAAATPAGPTRSR